MASGKHNPKPAPHDDSRLFPRWHALQRAPQYLAPAEIAWLKVGDLMINDAINP